MILNNFLKTLTVILLFISFNSWSNELGTPQCYGYLTELVRSSNFPFTDVTEEEINLLIDNDQGSKILAQLNYDKKEKDRENANSTALVGWIKYDIKNQRLFNVSAYLNEKPEELSFDKKYAIKFEQCHKQKEQIISEISCEKIYNQIKDKIVNFPRPLETFTVIGKGRLYFYSAPNDKCKISNNLFIIPKDTVVVYSEYNSFYYVMYIGKNNTVEGWIDSKRLKSTGRNIGPNTENKISN